MSDPALSTTQLLQRWYRGDSRALDLLIQRHLAWIQERVRQRLGPLLRQKTESADIMQVALLRFLRDGPRLAVENERRFRSLMALIVENVIRDQNDYFTACRRDMAREQELPDNTVVALDGIPGAVAECPSEAAERAETQAILRLALELLAPEDRHVILLRRRDQLSFQSIGEQLGIKASAADMRYRRAAGRLAKVVSHVRARDLDPILTVGDGPLS